MQISTKEILSLIGLASIIFLIAPLFLIGYVMSYNKRKRRNQEEKLLMQQTFENELLKTQMEVQEQTLKTIAYDLHDNIGQLLSLIMITLSTIDLRGNEAACEKIGNVNDLTRRSIKELKSLSKLLHGEELISRGLIEAISFELEWLNRSERYRIRFDVANYSSNAFDQTRETILFRLFQESINNIIQHASASEINVLLAHDDAGFIMEIKDNGMGFDVDQKLNSPKGMGLGNITKRSTLIDGHAEIRSVFGEGSVITIKIPNFPV